MKPTQEDGSGRLAWARPDAPGVGSTGGTGSIQGFGQLTWLYSEAACVT